MGISLAGSVVLSSAAVRLETLKKACSFYYILKYTKKMGAKYMIDGLGLASGYSGEKLESFEAAVNSVLEKHDLSKKEGQEQAWQGLCRVLMSKDFSDLKFQGHILLFDFVYRDRKEVDGPAPAWLPSTDIFGKSNTHRFMREMGFGDYRKLHRWSSDNRDLFWKSIIERLGIIFKKTPSSTSDISKGVERPLWLPEAELNIVDSCFKADKNKAAVYFGREGSDEIKSWSYGYLEGMVNRVANSLAESGFGGDAIGIDMPMIPESVAIYLGIIKAGCVCLSVPDSFAPPEIEKRLQIGKAKAMFTVDYFMRDGKKMEIYKKVKAACTLPTIVVPYGEGLDVELKQGDFVWGKFLVGNTEFVSVGKKPQDPTNILFSSGTTGEPKAIPWDHTTPIKAASDAYFHQDIHSDDILAWPTNLGWMMGPWLIYATLINRASMGLFVGSCAGNEFGRFVQNAGITMLGVIPSIVSAWKTKGCMEGLDWSTIQRFSSTGECSRKEDMLYLMSLAGYKPVIEYCGGTEIGGVYITGTMIQPSSPATFSTPAMGVDFLILDEEGKEAKNGEVFIIPPSMGLSTTLMNRDNYQVYYEGSPQLNGFRLRRHGDQVERVGGGYYMVHGRTDDTMNLSGIKVSSAEIERVLHSHHDVAETAAIGVIPKDRSACQLVIYIVSSKNEGSLDKVRLKEEFQNLIKTKLNPFYKIHDIVLVDSLPRTASNKVMRRLLRDEYQKAHNN